MMRGEDRWGTRLGCVRRAFLEHGAERSPQGSRGLETAGFRV